MLPCGGFKLVMSLRWLAKTMRRDAPSDLHGSRAARCGAAYSSVVTNQIRHELGHSFIRARSRLASDRIEHESAVSAQNERFDMQSI